MELSFTEENYIKGIYQLARIGNNGASTNAIAEYMNTKASSVTDMLKKLAKKDLIEYEPYKPVLLSDLGKKTAARIIRKHRLWEVFLVDKLGFGWDEVHEIAEELEHIHSEKLINRLEQFLGNPTHDPHGDPIPDSDGNIQHHKDITISDLEIGQYGMIIGLKDTSPSFLQYLDSNGLTLGKTVKINEITEYDQSMSITINMTTMLVISYRVAQNLYIKKLT
jgi:DtxR family transcriptional regulator, Mn-dependent transcriptional regulator